METSENGENVTFKAKPSDNYEFDYYNVGGNKYTDSTGDEITLNKSTNIQDNNTVVVEAVFKKSGSTTTHSSLMTSDNKGNDIKNNQIKKDDMEHDDTKEDDTQEDDTQDDTKEDDIKEDDTQDDTKEDDTKDNDAKQDDIKENDIKENDIKENDTKNDDAQQDIKEDIKDDTNNDAESKDVKGKTEGEDESDGGITPYADKHSISSASTTGGSVTTDKKDVEENENVQIIPKSDSGYVLTKVQVNGGNVDVKTEGEGKAYSFLMPDSDVEVTAEFEPINIILKSNMGGNASYSANSEKKVTINVKPNSAYTVGSIDAADASGKKLAISKKQSGSYVYELDITKMSKAPCTVNITFKKQNKNQAVNTSKNNIDDSIKELNDSSNKVQTSISSIKSIVEKSDGSYKGWNDLTHDEQNRLVEEVINLADYVSDMTTSASSMLRDMTTIYNILAPYASDAANEAKNDIDDATDCLHGMINSLKSANSGVKGIVNYINAQPDVRFVKLGDDFNNAKEGFHNQLKGLSLSVKNLSDNASSYNDIINDDLRAVNDQLNVVFNLLADRMANVEDLSIEELYEDVDDEDIDSITTGRADICTNKGIVQGDINVGGIAGSMSIDDEDPEDSAAGSVEYEIGRRFIMKCLVTESVNEGYVTAKKDGAGGICGYMNHGIITDSEGYGSVESTEGSYVGGICGESLTIIRDCYALCSVSGSQNVGGIAGYADTIKDCYAMADVKADNGRAGAIAGQVASYEEVSKADSNESKVSGNYYVGDDVFGIDNISYAGAAEPVSYSDLLTVEQLPAQFWHLNVIYKIEDTYLGSQEVKYGEKLNNLKYPDIPGKDGYYGVWPDVSDKRMTGTYVIEAEYRDNVTVVQSGAGDDSQKPYALVEDAFTEDTVLNVTLSDMAAPAEVGKNKNTVYEIKLENSDINVSDVFSVRLLNPYDENAKVYGYTDGKWTKLDSKVRGQYIQVSMTGDHEYFCVADTGANKIIIICASAAAVIVIILAVVKVKKKRIRRNKIRKTK